MSIYVNEKQHANLMRLLMFLEEVPWDCINQKAGTRYKMDMQERPCCFGAWGAVCFKKELLEMADYLFISWGCTERDTERGYFVSFKGAFKVLFGFSPTLLSKYGSHPEPFGSSEWPTHPKDVIRDLLFDVEVKDDNTHKPLKS